MCVKPIHNKQDYIAALRKIENLWDVTDQSTYEHDQLDVLGSLVAYHEELICPAKFPHPIEALKYYLTLKDISDHDLALVLGGAENTQEILERKRPLTLENIWALCKKWNIPAESLIKPYNLQSKDSGKSPSNP